MKFRYLYFLFDVHTLFILLCCYVHTIIYSLYVHCSYYYVHTILLFVVRTLFILLSCSVHTILLFAVHTLFIFISHMYISSGHLLTIIVIT